MRPLTWYKKQAGRASGISNKRLRRSRFLLQQKSGATKPRPQQHDFPEGEATTCDVTLANFCLFSSEEEEEAEADEPPSRRLLLEPSSKMQTTKLKFKLRPTSEKNKRKNKRNTAK